MSCYRVEMFENSVPKTLTGAAVLALLLTGSSCAFGGSRGDAGGVGLDASAQDAGGVTDAGRDASVAADSGVLGVDAGRPGTDGGPPGSDAGPLTDAGSSTDAGSLSSDLGLPDPSGATCTSPGSLGECPSIQVCRFYSPSEGRCESCEPCGNLNAACSSSAECDILFMCFQGRCTNFCTLGLSECGPPTDCLDVGHPTRGVCRP